MAIPILLQAPQSSLGSLKDLKGQAVVLEFWATWCGPCVQGIPAMNKMVEAFDGRPVRFISVTSEPSEQIEDFLRTHPMKAWIGIDSEGKAERAFRVHGIPAIFVIDQYGRIWHKVSPMFFYKSDVEDAINAPPPQVK
ncbi:MAG: TlpA family protein disulfide reductase [Elusimicrobia bacterium]|nr:TlpA family protein disulfide reductase [Elusimicrobiota bacterium]